MDIEEDEYLVLIVKTEEQDNENINNIKQEEDIEDTHTSSNQISNLVEESSNGDLYEDEPNTCKEDDWLIPKIGNKKKKHKVEFTPFITKLLEDNPHMKEDQEALVSALVSHMESVKPPEVDKDEYNLEPDGSHICKTCDIKIRHKLAFNRHYLEKHGPRYLSCYSCSYTFRSMYSLLRHERRCLEKTAPLVLKARSICAHIQVKKNSMSINSRRYHCSYCSASFKSKTSVVSHERVHKAERPFKCDQCTVAYTTKSALALHKKTHGEASFICDHCGAAFKSKNSVSSHLSSHYEPRFPCLECSRRFTYKAALQLHVHRKHRNLPLPCACQMCPKRFGRMSALKEHMMSAHGVVLMTRRMFFRQLPKLSDAEIKAAKVGFKSEVPTINPSDLDVLDDKIIQQIELGEELLKKQEQGESESLLNYETGSLINDS